MRKPPANLLRLDEQMCFPLYVASRLMTRLYQPILEPLEITYPQYLVLLVLWEHDTVSVSEIGKKTFLESNTLTPLLKKMEAKGLLSRSRSAEDERVVEISLTQSGKDLKEKASCVPMEIGKRSGFSLSKARELKAIVGDLIEHLESTATEAEK